jgi:streptogramin lyase
MEIGRVVMRLLAFLSLMAFAMVPASAGTITILDAESQPVPRAMVTMIADQFNAESEILPKSITKFADDQGVVTFSEEEKPLTVNYNMRAQGYKDASVTNVAASEDLQVTLVPETDPLALAEAMPSSSWLAALEFPDEALKKHFVTQCTYCHQQGNELTRYERNAGAWNATIQRMVGFGSRLASDAQEILPEILTQNYARLHENPELIKPLAPWESYLKDSIVYEWPVGDVGSNMHDALIAKTGSDLVYVGDDVKGDLIEVDLTTGKQITYKIPSEPGDERGGPLGFELDVFPDVGYVRIHSLAESMKDGHIFTTDARQSRIHEFNPKTKQFKAHQIPNGLFPHTIRIDQQDRVWFTMAVTNQVGMLDRATDKFTMYDLPARSFAEGIQIAAIPLMIKAAESGINLNNFPISRDVAGLPMPYGIDVAPNGDVWFTRLHADDIGRINGKTGEVTMFSTPFVGPRRMRTDRDGNVWVTGYADSIIAKFDPITEKFTQYDLPEMLGGGEIPYALNIDHDSGLVWVTGTASDTLMSMNMKTQEWRVYPMPRRGSYTRELVITSDGGVLTSTSSNPAWHTEGSQPTVILLKTGNRTQ